MYEGGLHLRAPRLRWSSPGRKAHRGVVSGTRCVRQGVRRAPADPITRPGKIRGGLADALDELGGSATLVELCEQLGRNPERARDLTRRKQSPKGRDGLAVLFVEAGVVTLDGDTLTLADNWLDALDELRREGREGQADERQRANHRQDRRDYRAGLAELAIKRSHEKRAAEMTKQAGSVEDLERVADPDPELLTMLQGVLRRYPDHRDDYAGWFASTLWAEDYVEAKPDALAVEVALYELRERAGVV